jgi:hypothetical protein
MTRKIGQGNVIACWNIHSLGGCKSGFQLKSAKRRRLFASYSCGDFQHEVWILHLVFDVILFCLQCRYVWGILCWRTMVVSQNVCKNRFLTSNQFLAIAFHLHVDMICKLLRWIWCWWWIRNRHCFTLYDNQNFLGWAESGYTVVRILFLLNIGPFSLL